MEQALEFLKYGVLGFSTLAIIYSFQVINKEQAREGEARESILNFSNTLLKYAVFLTIILAVVQIYEKVLHKDTLMLESGKTVEWSAESFAFPEPPMILLPNGMPDFDAVFNDTNGILAKHGREKFKTIEQVISLCGQNLRYSIPLISPNNPATNSQIIILDGKALTRPVLIEIEKGIGIQEGPLGTFSKESEFSSYKVDKGEVAPIQIDGATSIQIYPYKCV